MDGLLKRIAKFIVADDQVLFFGVIYGIFYLLSLQSLRVIECPEFRDMLLYACHEIEDTDIVKRDSIRSLIINSNARYFKQLKKDLSVRFLLSKMFNKSRILI